MLIENGKLNSALENTRIELNKINEEKEVLRDLVDKSKQPYSYLVKRIEELEIEGIRNKQLVQEKELTVKRMINENDMLEQKVITLQADLKSVLSNRKKLENIEDIIYKFSGCRDSDNQQDSGFRKTDSNKIYSLEQKDGGLKEKSIVLATSNGVNPFKGTLAETGFGIGQAQSKGLAQGQQIGQSDGFIINSGNYNNLNNGKYFVSNTQPNFNFNPNTTNSSGLGGVVVPNSEVRQSIGVNSLSPISQNQINNQNNEKSYSYNYNTNNNISNTNTEEKLPQWYVNLKMKKSVNK